MDKMLRNKKTIAFFVLPGLLIFVITFLLPIFMTTGYSFMEWNGMSDMEFIGIDNYIKLFTKDPIFWTGVKNTLIFLVACMLGQLPMALLLALLLSHFTKGVKFYKIAFFIPILLSSAAIALLWNKAYEPNFGLIKQVVGMFIPGWTQEWLSKPETVVQAVAAPVIWQYVGYHMVILYAGIKSIPEQYYEAALIDGASGIRATWHVTLPLLRDIIKVCVVLCAVGSLKMFDMIHIMTGGGPYNSSTTVALQMYNEAFLKMQYGYGSAIAVFLVVECLLVAFVINKLVEGEEIQY